MDNLHHGRAPEGLSVRLRDGACGLGGMAIREVLRKASLTAIILAFACAAGIRERLAEIGFTGIVTLRQVPKEICGPIIVRATLAGREWKDNSIGDRMGRIDSSAVVYLGEHWPVTSAAFANFEDATYFAVETKRFLLLLANMPKEDSRGRFSMVIQFKSGRVEKYIIE